MYTTSLLYQVGILSGKVIFVLRTPGKNVMDQCFFSTISTITFGLTSQVPFLFIFLSLRNNTCVCEGIKRYRLHDY